MTADFAPGIRGDLLAAFADRSLLIVDDDRPFSIQFARAMESRGYDVQVADSAAAGIAAVESRAPAFAVIDMRLGDGDGLDVIARLKVCRPDARGVILTGYGNIATAVTAVKLGAFDYLAKPADADVVHGALTAPPGGHADPPENPMSAARVKWEYLQRAYDLCGHNITHTAKHLSMHRRTLQRVLKKCVPR